MGENDYKKKHTMHLMADCPAWLAACPCCPMQASEAPWRQQPPFSLCTGHLLRFICAVVELLPAVRALGADDCTPEKILVPANGDEQNSGRTQRWQYFSGSSLALDAIPSVQTPDAPDALRISFLVYIYDVSLL
jgi:hypothetical protein